MRKILLLSLAALAITACERKTAADAYKAFRQPALLSIKTGILLRV